jgi:hypothetical protein
MLDNEFTSEDNVLLRATSVAERANTNQQQEQASAKPETLHGLSADTGQNFPKPIFVIHAYSLEQARALVAAKVARETIVVGPVSLDGAGQ